MNIFIPSNFDSLYKIDLIGFLNNKNFLCISFTFIILQNFYKKMSHSIHPLSLDLDLE